AWLWAPTELQGSGAAADESVTLEEITEANIDEVADLRVDESQKLHVASVGKTFWQAARRDDVRVRAICAGGRPVGLVALKDPGPGDGGEYEIYFARLLVDRRFQGRGYGRAAIRRVIELARAR